MLSLKTIWACWVETPGPPYLDQQLWGGVGIHYSTGHFQADPVQLLNLSPPDQCESPASTVHLCPSGPVTLQAEGETSLISELPVNSTVEELQVIHYSCTYPFTGLRQVGTVSHLAYLRALFPSRFT